MKRLTAILLSLLFLLTALPLGAVSVAADSSTNTPTTIAADPIVVSVEMPNVCIMTETKGWWEDEDFFYYREYAIRPNSDDIVITLADGTVEHGTGFWFGDEYYSLEIEDQTYDNRLLPGDNEVSFTIADYTGTYIVTVTDQPVVRAKMPVIHLTENRGGRWTTEMVWDETLGKEVEKRYYVYDYGEYLDDTLLYMANDAVIWEGDQYDYSIEVEPTTYANRLLPGINTRHYTVGGYEGTFTIVVGENPIASIEIDPLMLNQYVDGEFDYDYYWDDNDKIVYQEFFHYNIMPRRVVITTKDGVKHYPSLSWSQDWRGEYVCSIEWEGTYYELDIQDPQSRTNAWGVGDYTITGSVLGMEFSYDVTVQESAGNSDYDYADADGGIIITGCKVPAATLEIPSTIDGKTVVGVADLGYHPSICHLVLPDSVTYIGDYLLSNNLRSVSFGAGIKNLHADMFLDCYNLESISISAANPYFTVVDNAVYNKAVTSFIAYPQACADKDHTVPNTVTDLAITAHLAYERLNLTVADGHPGIVTVDGVTYDQNMTRVLWCDKNKSGVYVMPSTVTEMAEHAFRGCTQLTEVTVAPSVTTIMYFSFSGCTGLQTIHLPEGLVCIEPGAFSNTRALESITLPKTLTEIGWDAFEYSGLTSLTLPDSVKTVGSEAFADTPLATLDLGNGVEQIGYSAFEGTLLQSIVLPDSLTYLGSEAFSSCYDLKSVSIGRGLTAIEGSTFASCGLESVDIPDTVRSIGSAAFAHCFDLQSVTLREGLETIYSSAFSGCESLTSIVIPDSVDWLGSYAFYDCTSLTYAVVGCGVPMIDEYTFENCPLETLDLRGGGLTTIGRYAFRGGNMTTLTIPDSVTSIMYGAFQDCAPLTTINIPATVMDLGHESFDGTAWYKQQDDGVTYLSHIAYDWKGAMPVLPQPLMLVEGTTVIADAAFARQPNLSRVVLPESLQVIGNYAFYEDSRLTSVCLGTDLRLIQSDAFLRCNYLTDVYYTGSEADRDRIIIESGNDQLLYATWHYNSCPMGHHKYDNACDNTCNRCDWVNPTSLGHHYDNDCDATCNRCDWERTPPHGYADACDSSCDLCGETRVAPHDYDNGYDAECNLCGLTREVPDVAPGDTNGDGKINVRDLGMLQQYINGWSVDVNTAAADVNGDGKVNVRDIGLMQQYINGWDVTLGG